MEKIILQENQSIIWNKNCLNTVRLIAAISVMYNHAWVHLGIQPPVELTQVLNFFLGVPIFFSMSGFLIWNSIAKSADFWEYAKKRFFRIYPELWCGVVLGLIVLVILADEPLCWFDLGIFAITQGTFLQFWTPNSLRFYGCGTPNGSLWTICVLIQFYIVAYFLYKKLTKEKIAHWGLLLVAAIAVTANSPRLTSFLPEVLYKLYNQTLLPYFWLFILGAMIAQYRQRMIPFLKKYWYCFLLLAFFLMKYVADISGGGYPVIRSIALIMGLIGFAYRFPQWNIKTDISYGIYIYHMIVVNAMIELGLIGRLEYLLVAMVVSCILAYCSLKCVGKIANCRKL